METKVIVRKEDALKKVFKGVSLDSLAVGAKSMVTKMNYVKGNFATTHEHPHEQCGYVISELLRANVANSRQCFIRSGSISFVLSYARTERR